MEIQRSPRERTLEAELLGREVQFDYSEPWVGVAVVALRVGMGWLFLQAGLRKLSIGGWEDPGAWSAESFLVHAVVDENPLRGLFLWFAEVGWLVDPLVVAGEVLVGLALLAGAFVRLAALCGVAVQALLWAASWRAGPAAGIPVGRGYVVDEHAIYLLALFGLAAVGAGRVVGLDHRLERTSVVEERPWLKYLLG